MLFKRKPKNYTVSNLPPGTITYKGKKQLTTTHIEVFNFNSENLEHFCSQKIEDAFTFKHTDTVTWININGLNNIQAIETIGEHYGIHPLTLEDIANTSQRPKIDEFDSYLFIVFKMLWFNDNNQLIYEHVSMVMGEGFVITFQESDGDVFDALRDRIRQSRGRVRNSGMDYLAYVILDAVVDNYFSVMEVVSESIEELETHLFDSEVQEAMAAEIQQMKRQILKIRRSIIPLRDVINRMEKNDMRFIDSHTQKYIQDLYDHIIQVSESVDLYREMIWGLMDMHMTIISNKMNEIMKVLTIIATIFIPLTFIAGIYGMNFEYMPELTYPNAYFILLGFMAIVFIIMLIYFRRKKWL